MRGVLANNGNNSLETINAAANAIASADHRIQQDTVQRKRWGSCWSIYWCFGSPKQGKRFGHSVLVPETTLQENDVPTADNSTHASTVTLPFVAPPSSPASFLQSDPPSSSQSPAGFFSLSLSANVYSPTGPSSIFAIGPYAHETQLVSPPVFSTFTTEPSTAPFTPPPESVHLTTPSSPEVPFAKFLFSSLDPTHKSRDTARTFPSPFPSSHYSEFQAYQLYPGSPVGQLISPSSVVSGSGTSSPFPDFECPSGRRPTPPTSGHGFFPNEPPKLCSVDGFASRKLSPQQGQCSSSISSDSCRPTVDQDSLLLESQISAIGDLTDKSHHEEFNPRLSFGLSADEVASCAKTELLVLAEAESEIQTEIPLVLTGRDEEMPQTALSQCHECQHCKDGPMNSCEVSVDSDDKSLDNREEEQQQNQPSTPAVSTVREFKFDNADGAVEPTISSEWWTNEKKTRMEAGPNNWAFFPIVQPGVS